jgi:hypothetical protein
MASRFINKGMISGTRLAGNTIATPELSPFETIELFVSLGLDGIDFLCDDPESTSGVTVRLDRPAARDRLSAGYRRSHPPSIYVRRSRIR